MTSEDWSVFCALFLSAALALVFIYQRRRMLGFSVIWHMIEFDDKLGKQNRYWLHLHRIIVYQ